VPIRLSNLKKLTLPIRSLASQDGFYPRVNATLLATGKFASRIVSVVGKQVSCEAGKLTLQTGDEQFVECLVHPEFEQEGTDFVEVVGCVGNGEETEMGKVELYIARPLGNDINLQLYDKMITLQNSPKYQHLFRQPDFVENN